MRIFDMKVCDIAMPVGFAVSPLRLSWKVDETDAKKQVAAQVTVSDCSRFDTVLYDSGKREDIDSLCFVPEIKLAPRMRYYWKVIVWADNGDSAEAESFFETGKMGEPWVGKWITSDVRENMYLVKEFSIDKPIKSARAYATALGVYELYINGEKAGDEYLTPYYNGYDSWLQTTVFDITDMIRKGENSIRFMMGGGWAVSRFGLGNGANGVTGLYANHEALLAEFRIEYEDGIQCVFGTNVDWEATKSHVQFASIYDGEIYDATQDVSERYPVKLDNQTDYTRIEDRLSPPLRITERIKPVKLIKTPKNELVIDLGQEITGWLEFICNAPKGTIVKLSYSEILQNDCFYRDNLRSAREEYTYISDGIKHIVRPYHTFFGFRLIKVEGLAESDIHLEDFTGCVLHSDIPRIGYVETNNAMVNRFILNTLWGQRGNFLDTPTDCPQRDERLGWTGDAQAFSGTACFNMDCQAFFRKYLHDMYYEQKKFGGSCPHVIPICGMNGNEGGSCAWGDAATVIPWNIYLFYGDIYLLKETYPNMKAWVEWIRRTEEANGCGRLWNVGFHFADWLALDTKNNSVMGATDAYFIASAFYYYSTSLLLKAAKTLRYDADVEFYTKLLDEIYEAIQNEYFTPNGLMAQTTQTAYVCALFMNFAPQEHRARLATLLDKELRETNGKLRTGFVGTAYLNRVLSNNGYNRRAYNLFLNKEYPGWLYEVTMGATTVWERWNSVLPNGMISDTGMNSLNHYAYGAVMEWIYRDVAGINPTESAPGFRKALLRPNPDYLLPQVTCKYNSAMGWYESSWKIKKDLFVWDITIPFGAEASAFFPKADLETLRALYGNITFEVCEQCGDVYALLPAGKYHFEYKPITTLHRVISVDMSLNELLDIPEAVEVMIKAYPPMKEMIQQSGVFRDSEASLRETLNRVPSFGPKYPDNLLGTFEVALAPLND